jgi:hypothetical protein
LRSLELHLSSHEVAMAFSLGRKPKELEANAPLSREAATANQRGSACCRRSAAYVVFLLFPWAHAQGYMLSSRRDFQIRNFKTLAASLCVSFERMVI